MNTNLMFRKGEKRDLDEIENFIINAIKKMESEGIMQWDDIYPTRDDFAVDIRRGELMVAMMDDTIVAVFTINQECDKEYQNGAWKNPNAAFCVVHRLCVNSKYQNIGIATAVMKYVQEVAFYQNKEWIRLDVYSLNSYALRLYQKLGYVKTGTAHWRKGEFYLMEKWIEN